MTVSDFTDVSKPDPADRLPTPTPSQSRAIEHALSCAAGAHLIVLVGEPGMGRTTVLQHLHARLGGTLVTLDDVLVALAKFPPDRMEEAIFDLLRTRYQTSDLLIFDDMGMLQDFGGEVPERPQYLRTMIAAMYNDALDLGRKLILTTTYLTSELAAQAVVIDLDSLEVEDYQSMIAGLTGSDTSDFDIQRLSRTFKKLTAHQIVTATNVLREEGKLKPTADDYIGVFELLIAKSNVNLEEVDDVSLDSLVGVDEIVRRLQRTVLIPMTEPALSQELGLRPKRGVLLYGEPGTGKTTIGRALARAMKGKFFMIDGTAVPDTPGFNGLVESVLAAAEASSPAVIFIDDADVIFRHGQQMAFARKLLSKLDGIESETQGNVCIVMTAMDVSDMPPAMLRSGRVEVWLEMKLPDHNGRLDIIRHYAKGLPEALQVFDEAKVADATDGFTPADIRGLVGDARGHIAFDRHKGRDVKSFEQYLLLAAEEISERKGMLRQFMPRAA